MLSANLLFCVLVVFLSIDRSNDGMRSLCLTHKTISKLLILLKTHIVLSSCLADSNVLNSSHVKGFSPTQGLVKVFFVLSVQVVYYVFAVFGIWLFEGAIKPPPEIR